MTVIFRFVILKPTFVLTQGECVGASVGLFVYSLSRDLQSALFDGSVTATLYLRDGVFVGRVQGRAIRGWMADSWIIGLSLTDLINVNRQRQRQTHDGRRTK